MSQKLPSNHTLRSLLLHPSIPSIDRVLSSHNDHRLYKRPHVRATSRGLSLRAEQLACASPQGQVDASISSSLGDWGTCTGKLAISLKGPQHLSVLANERTRAALCDLREGALTETRAPAVDEEAPTMEQTMIPNVLQLCVELRENESGGWSVAGGTSGWHWYLYYAQADPTCGELRRH